MASPAPPLRTMSVADYLALEAESSVRHEYVDGQIYAMTGATRLHNRLVGRIARRLGTLADASGCRQYAETVRCRVGREVYYYPDVMVACGPEPADPLAEESPCLLVEVLSPSSVDTDRVEKAMRYRDLPSVMAYLIVHQEYRCVEVDLRDARGGWTRAVRHDDGVLALPCPAGATIDLAMIYEGLGVPDVERARAAGVPILD